MSLGHAKWKMTDSNRFAIFIFCLVHSKIVCCRDQSSCGSCYVFAARGMIEPRLAIKTQNAMKVSLAPQEIVSCSKYSQGCGGGFAFLVSKYAKVSNNHIQSDGHK